MILYEYVILFLWNHASHWLTIEATAATAIYITAYQAFTADQWSKLESAGAVFLPAAGYRYGSDVGNVQYNGGYWSATGRSSGYAYCLLFYSDEADVDYNYRYYGHSVRLVKDL